jgi:hypothetical protein
MIEQISIHNFRGFSTIQVSGLKRVNVIVGRNASGKTAFLESIFMASSGAGPQVTLQLRALRQFGGQVVLAVPDSVAYRSLWADLFHWFEQDKTISIEIVGTDNDSRSMHISYGQPESQLLPFDTKTVTPSQPLSPAVMPQIVFEWRRGDDPPIVVRPKFTAKGLEIEGGTVEHFPILFFGPHITDLPEENARRFSELSKVGESKAIENAVRTEYPFITRLSIEYSASLPAVWASLKNSRQKIPVALISDGINKLMSILLGIAARRKGTMLIDQIEDGFYFARMPSVWKMIYRFAEENEVQIFATTHSIECLTALREAMRSHEDDFALIHAELKNGYCDLKMTKGKFLEAALGQGFELR